MIHNRRLHDLLTTRGTALGAPRILENTSPDSPARNGLEGKRFPDGRGTRYYFDQRAADVQGVSEHAETKFVPGGAVTIGRVQHDS